MSDTSVVLHTLVDEGVISPEQAERIDLELHHQTGEAVQSKRQLLSEILSYVGGAVVLISAIFILANGWDQFGPWGRFGFLAGAAAVMAVAGGVLTASRRDDSARRLSSTLFSGAAVVMGFAMGMIVNNYLPQPPENPYGDYTPEDWVIPLTVLSGAATAFVLTLAGYVRSKSAVGHIVLGASATLATEMGAQLLVVRVFTIEDYPVTAGIFVTILGLAWLAASRAGWLRERTIGEIVSVAILFTGVLSLHGSAWEDLAATAMLVLGALLLGLYLLWRSWPFLAGGVVAILAGGTELFVRHFTGIGAALASMALGAVILALGIVLLRGRHRPDQVSSN